MKILRTLFLVLSLFLLSGNTTYNNPYNTNISTVPLDTSFETKGDLYDFMDAIGKRESGGNYKIINKYGCLGKYQFCSLRNVPEAKSRSHFLNDPDLQDRAMIALLKRNKSRLQSYIDLHANVLTINGVVITESGILAGAHLAGPGGMESYLKYRRDSKDAFGTSITSYMIKFSGYKLDI